MIDDVKMPSMDAAMLTALTPSLQPTGEHKALPDGYCPDCCGAPCIRTWLAPAGCVYCNSPEREGPCFGGDKCMADAARTGE